MIINDQLREVLLENIEKNISAYILELYTPWLECIRQMPNVTSNFEARAIQKQADAEIQIAAQKLDILSLFILSDAEYKSFSRDLLTQTFETAIQVLDNLSEADKQALRTEIPAAVNHLLPILLTVFGANRVKSKLHNYYFDAVGVRMLTSLAKSDLFNSCDVDIFASFAYVWDTTSGAFAGEFIDLLWSTAEFSSFMQGLSPSSNMQEIYNNARSINDATKDMLPVWNITAGQFDPEANLGINEDLLPTVDTARYDPNTDVRYAFDKYKQDSNLVALLAQEITANLASSFQRLFGITIEQHNQNLENSHTLEPEARAKLCKRNALANIVYSTSLEFFSRKGVEAKFTAFITANNLNEQLNQFTPSEIKERCIDPLVRDVKQALVGDQVYVCGTLCAHFKWPQRQVEAQVSVASANRLAM